MVHKFRAFGEELTDALQNSYLYFAPPARLNDPFDCQLDLVLAFKLAYARGGPVADADVSERWARYAKDIAEKASACGVFSSSYGAIAGDDLGLLWSYYADGYRGICLTYEIPAEFVRQNLIGVGPVEYGESLLLNALRALDLSKELRYDTSVERVITLYLTTKRSTWRHETETRFIAPSPGEIELPRECLRQVCFGHESATDPTPARDQ